MSKTTKNSDWRCSIIAQFRARSSDDLVRLKDIINQNERLRKENASIKIGMAKKIEQINQATTLSKNGESTKLNYEILTLKNELEKNKNEIINLKEINAKQTNQICKLETDNNYLLSTLKKKTESIENFTIKIDELESTISEMRNLNNFFKSTWALAREEVDGFKDKCINLQENLNQALDDNHVFQEHIKVLNSQVETITKNEDFLLVDSVEANIVSKVLTEECEEALNLEENTPINWLNSRTSISEFPSSGSVPSRLYLKFVAHESEIQSICWAPHGNILATGGFDHEIKLWNISFAHTYNRKTLVGSSGIINSLQFSFTGSHILAACSDNAARIWNIQNENLQSTLTGHAKKVLCAKFLDYSIKKVVTGSRDGTIKYWDVNNLNCLNTKLVNSTCHDLVINNLYTPSIISGHFDNKLRFWDMREEQYYNQIKMPDIITSLDVSRDGYSLLCSLRNNTLKIIDLRYDTEMKSFTNNEFTINSNLSKAKFNSIGSKVSSGSANGSVFIWDAVDTLLEEELKSNHRNNPSRKSSIYSIAWHPVDSVLASVGETGECKIWA